MSLLSSATFNANKMADVGGFGDYQTNDSVIATVKGSEFINGIHTDIACTHFDNTVFIVISQLEKFGTLIHVSRDVVLEESTGVPTFTTRTVLGEDEELLNVVARNLAAHVGVPKPILFALALKDRSPSAIKDVATLMLKHKCW